MDREGRKDGSRELKHGTKETEKMGEKGLEWMPKQLSGNKPAR